MGRDLGEWMEEEDGDWRGTEESGREKMMERD